MTGTESSAATTGDPRAENGAWQIGDLVAGVSIGQWLEIVDESGDVVAYVSEAKYAPLIAAAPTMHEALGKIAWGTEDRSPPFRALPRESMKSIAQDVIRRLHATEARVTAPQEPTNTTPS